MSTSLHPHHVTLSQSLTAKSLPPSSTWLTTFLTTSHQTTSPAAAALTSTAAYRILASDIRTTLSTSSVHILPQDIALPSITERRLPSQVVVQVLDCIDVGTSLVNQVEEWEMAARGEARGQGRGRGVIIRVTGEEDGDGNGNGDGNGRHEDGGNGSKGTWKVLLQDANGGLIWGLDGDGVLNVNAGIGTGNGGRFEQGSGVSVGTKLLLKKGTLVARGVVLLEQDKVSVLGGKNDQFEKDWREGRLERLKSMMPVRT